MPDVRNIKAWLAGVGLPYHSSHKFRHGHIHYGLERAKTMADFKAVSMNMPMHSSIRTTDEVYSRLNDSEMQVKIERLGNAIERAGENNEVDFRLFQAFIQWWRSRDKT